LISGCALAGKLIADNQKNRCEYQRSIISFLSAAENRIKSTKIPFSELIDEMSQYEEYPVFLKKCNSLLRGGETLRNAWKISVEADENIRKTDSEKLLSAMGNQLGATDAEGQLLCIGCCRREIERKLVDEEEKSRKYSGIFPALGVLAGVWVIILYI